MSKSADIHRIALEKFGFEKLRSGQEEAIRSILDGHDTLAVMPTGEGKSPIYQIATLLLSGLTVVVSPLIALQNDQTQSINQKLDNNAIAAVINSTLSVLEFSCLCGQRKLKVSDDETESSQHQQRR